MEIQPTPGQEAFIRQAIESGRINRPEAALEEALSLWEEQERRRAEILSVVEQSEASFAQGKYRRVTSEEESRQYARDVAERGKARLTEIITAR